MAELNFNPNTGMVGSFVDTEDLKKYLDEQQGILDELKHNVKQLDESIVKNPENAKQLEEMRERCVEEIKKSEAMFENITNFLKEYQAANNAVMGTVSSLTLG